MVDAVTAQVAWKYAKADLFGGVAPSVSPVLVSIGAQPGAGKTRALEASLKTFYSGQTFVSIIGDDFRIKSYARCLIRKLCRARRLSCLAGW